MENKEQNFGRGAIIDIPDTRDFVFSGMTKPFDWNLGFDIELLLGYRKYIGSEEAFFGPGGKSGWGYERYKQIVFEVKNNLIPPFVIKPKNQNGSFSCTGQGASIYLSVLNFIETGEWVEFSARDIYAFISLGYGKGAILRDAIKRCVDPGVATEALISSYENGNPPSEDFMLIKPEETGEIQKIRKIFSSNEYRVIPDTGNIAEDIAWSMLLNFGCFGGVIGSNNGSWFSENPTPPKNGDKFWGHAIFFGKAKNKEISLLNSWGENCGKNGWQTLGENWFNSIINVDGIKQLPIFNPWVLIDKNNIINNLANMVIKKVKINGALGVLVDTPNGSQIIKAINEEMWRSWSKHDSYQIKTVNADGSTNWDVDLDINF